MSSTHETISLTTPDGEMPTFLSSPSAVSESAERSKGAVLVVQEAFGLTPHLENICKRFTEAGWTAIAPALFHRQGSPVLSYESYEAVMPYVGSLNATQLTMDLEATFNYLHSLGFTRENCAIVGFCMGGNVAFCEATREPLGAAATFYGSGLLEGRFGFPSLLELAPKMQTPWIGFYGDKDQSIPPEQVEQLRDALKGAPVDTELVRYAQTGHAFNNDDRPDTYDSESADDAWVRTLEWFDTHAAKR